MSEKQKKFSKIEYNNKYNEQNYARIGLRIKPDEKEWIEKLAKEEGTSVTKLLINSVKKVYKKH